MLKLRNLDTKIDEEYYVLYEDDQTFYAASKTFENKSTLGGLSSIEIINVFELTVGHKGKSSKKELWCELKIKEKDAKRKDTDTALIIMPVESLQLYYKTNLLPIVNPLSDIIYKNAGKGKKRSEVFVNGLKGKKLEKFKGDEGCWFQFEDDVGGCSLDGDFKKGTVLFLTKEKIESSTKKDNNSGSRKKPRADYRSRKRRS